MDYGYIRVSSREQNINRQQDAMEKLKIPIENLFVDKQTGSNFERPSYQKMLKKLKKGDLVVIKSIDRLGRNYEEILEQWRIITKVRQADVFVIDFPLLDTRKKDNDLTGTFIADLVLQILSYVAQTEREFIRQRQAEGIAAAKSRGVRFGKSKYEPSENFYEACVRYGSGEVTVRQAADMCGMKHSTFYKYFHLYENKSVK